MSKLFTSKLVALFFVSCACAFAQAAPWMNAINAQLMTNFQPTKASADRSMIVTAGTVVVLRKDGLRLFTLDHKFPPGNTYSGGVIKESFLGKTTPDGPARTFVAGEKLWLTKVVFEAKGDGVNLEFLSDPFDDTRYWGTLKFTWPKGSPPTPSEFAKTVSEVMAPDSPAGKRSGFTDEGAGQGWELPIRNRLLSQYQLTETSKDGSAIVTQGTAIVLRKDSLRLAVTAQKEVAISNYSGGAIKPGKVALETPDGAARTFAPGERLWLTQINFGTTVDAILLGFISDPIGGTRYWGGVTFVYLKGAHPTPEDFAKTLAEIMKADDTTTPVPVSPAPVVVPVEQAPPPPIAPPPPPADQPPPTVSLGQTKDQVVANFGQPTRIANLGSKQILYYKDFKVTLTNGKVTDVQ